MQGAKRIAWLMKRAYPYVTQYEDELDNWHACVEKFVELYTAHDPDFCAQSFRQACGIEQLKGSIPDAED